MNDNTRLIEALLFAAKEPLKIDDIYGYVGENVDVGAALADLKTHYKDRGIALVESEGRWSFRTAADLGDALQREEEEMKKPSKARDGDIGDYCLSSTRHPRRD